MLGAILIQPSTYDKIQQVVKVFEGLNENKKEMISYYRINLDSNSDKQFVYQTFDFERNITWGIYSKKINSLICR
jgi:hypothetical protein